MKGIWKLGAALALAAAAAAFLLIAASGARDRGRTTYCRNNLRKIGEMAYQRLVAEELTEATGRAYWQEIREENFTNLRGGKKTWVMRFGGLNPFGCPVRGVQPLDLSLLSAEELERHMSDPMTIDYRGPRLAAGMLSATPYILGADFDRNHPGGGGHVLLVNHTVREIHAAVGVKKFLDEPRAGESLSD
jgi:hypothetical protein